MLIVILRIFIGAVFAFTGILKFLDINSFIEAVDRFELIPHAYINYVGVIIPSAELICGFALMFGLFKKGSIYILTFLMTIFTIAIGITLSKGIVFDCSCFGPLQKYLSPEMSGKSIIFNLWLIGIMLVLIIKDTYTNSFEQDLKVLTWGIVTLLLIGTIPISNDHFEKDLYGKQIVNINFKLALEIAEKEKAIFVDAREPNRYKRAHVPGAKLVPYGMVDDYLHNLSEIPKDRPLLVYCKNSVCGASTKVAIELMKHGYKKLYVVKEGFDLWIE